MLQNMALIMLSACLTIAYNIACPAKPDDGEQQPSHGCGGCRAEGNEQVLQYRQLMGYDLEVQSA